MKFITGLVSLLISGNVFAANLCETSCELSITFPAGGSLEAIEPATITFGTGGYIDDGSTITGFSAGETIALEALESIDFDSNGSFDLGYGGNIDYSSIQVDSSGEIKIASVGTDSKIYFYNAAFLGLEAVSISGSTVVSEEGALHIKSGEQAPSTVIDLSGHRALSAHVGLEGASITLENQTYNGITDLVLMDTDSPITFEASEAVIESLAVSGAAQLSPPVVPAVSNSGNAAGAGGSGGLGWFSLLAMIALTVFRRYR